MNTPCSSPAPEIPDVALVYAGTAVFGQCDTGRLAGWIQLDPGVVDAAVDELAVAEVVTVDVRSSGERTVVCSLRP